jgi:hypothetical protein
MRLLAERESNGIVVRLFWDDAAAPGSDVVVKYRDLREGVAYFLYPPRECALEAFYHPNAFAHRRGGSRLPRRGSFAASTEPPRTA